MTKQIVYLFTEDEKSICFQTVSFGDFIIGPYEVVCLFFPLGAYDKIMGRMRNDNILLCNWIGINYKEIEDKNELDINGNLISYFKDLNDMIQLFAGKKIAAEIHWDDRCFEAAYLNGVDFEPDDMIGRQRERESEIKRKMFPHQLALTLIVWCRSNYKSPIWPSFDNIFGQKPLFDKHNHRPLNVACFL